MLLLVTCCCSDDACTEEVELLVASLEEADRELCPGCDCTLQVVGISGAEPVELTAAVVAILRTGAAAPLAVAA